MAEMGDMAGIGGAAGAEVRPAPQEKSRRALRMLERLVAGSTLTRSRLARGFRRSGRASWSPRSSPSAVSTLSRPSNGRG
jgi:hypothetical protein